MLKRAIYLIPLCVALAVAAMVITAYRGDQENYEQKLQSQASHALMTAQFRLEEELDSQLRLIDALKAYIEINPDMADAVFQALAKGVAGGRQNIRSLQLAKGDIITHVYPLGNGHSLLGRDIDSTGSTRLRTLAARVRETGSVQFLFPSAKQADTLNIALFAPVYVHDLRGNPKYWGQICLYLGAGDFYRQAGLLDDSSPVLFALCQVDPLSGESRLLAGEPAVFDMKPVATEIKIPAGFWTLAAVPRTGWQDSPYGEYILAVGILAVLLIPSSVWWIAGMLLGRLRDRERYYQLVHSAKSLILRVDLAGNIVFCNEYTEEFFGYGPGELVGRPFVGTLIPARDTCGQSMKRCLSRLLRNPAAHPFNETISLRKSGETVWVAWANDSVVTDDGTVVGLLCVGTDITDRKLMEESLRQREKQYRLLAENVSDIIWGLDADLRYTYVSPSDEQVRGFPRQDVLGRPLEDFLTPGARLRFKEALAVLRVQAEDEGHKASVTEDLEFTCRDGSSVWLESRLGILFSDDGVNIGLQGVSRDITDRKRAEALREDVERMARHDLKTPLGAVIALPEEIRRLGGLDKAQQAMLTTVEHAGQNMLTLINRSLDLYKMECGTYVLVRTEVDVVDLLVQIKAEFGQAVRDKGVSLAVDMEGGAPGNSFMVTVDRELFRSMLSNLLLNAIQASPESGAVTVRLSRDDMVRITIRNRGEVPDSLRDTFFDKYATSNPSRGSGLGTFSARLIARTHGGDITVDTRTPGETAVCVTLPL